MYVDCRHPNIVLFMGVCLDHGDPIIVTELRSCDLFGYLKMKELSLNEKLRIALQICRGMNWLHGNDPYILHSDLKPENVLIDLSHDRAKVNFILELNLSYVILDCLRLLRGNISYQMVLLEHLFICRLVSYKLTLIG